MSQASELLAELHVLNLYQSSSLHEGIKIHHEAAEDIISAAKRLFDKGLISQQDGGYLTNLGVEATEHARALLNILQVPV